MDRPWCWTNDPRRFAHSVFPPLNDMEDDSNLYVEAELPELELSDLEIIVNGDNQLSIKGERKQPERENGRWHIARSEAMAASRGSASCRSTWTVTRSRPNSNTGVLTITLPKRKEARARRIEVKAS